MARFVASLFGCFRAVVFGFGFSFEDEDVGCGCVVPVVGVVAFGNWSGVDESVVVGWSDAVDDGVVMGGVVVDCSGVGFGMCGGAAGRVDERADLGDDDVEDVDEDGGDDEGWCVEWGWYVFAGDVGSGESLVRSSGEFGSISFS